MPQDGIFIHYLVEELKPVLIGGKINKIHQPSPLLLLFQIRNKGTNYNLLISSTIDTPRMHLTEQKFVNPQNPLNFCTLLRKHLERGEITDLVQYNNDRLIIMKINSYDELGYETTFSLMIELMGRNSNIILVNDENKIIDAVRKIPPSVSNTRLIIPKASYHYPESNKLNPYSVDEDFINYDQLEGCSKVLINEINNTQENILNIINQPVNPVLFQKDKPDFYCFDLKHLNVNKQFFPSLSILLDHFYTSTLKTKTEDANNLKRVVKNKLNHCYKKENNLIDDLNKAEENLKYNDLGILLQTNLYQVKKGMETITVINFLSNNEEIVINLDPNKDPSENLKAFFTKGKKAKKTLVEANKQLVLVREEIEYLENILFQLEDATPTECEEIKNELIQNGYIKNKAKRSSKNQKLSITKYTIDNIDIYVGKNNLQNNFLTHTLAKPIDYWFHIKDGTGSHVIVKVPNIEFELTENIIRFAANAASYYSKFRTSSSVPVDYTRVKYIKKIPGQMGSKVTYTNQLTIYIDPVEPKINNIS